MVSLGTITACSASMANHCASPSQMGGPSIQIGVPGTNASGNTTRSAPRTSGPARISSTRASVASRSMSTCAACTAATVTVAI